MLLVSGTIKTAVAPWTRTKPRIFLLKCAPQPSISRAFSRTEPRKRRRESLSPTSPFTCCTRRSCFTNSTQMVRMLLVDATGVQPLNRDNCFSLMSSDVTGVVCYIMQDYRRRSIVAGGVQKTVRRDRQGRERGILLHNCSAGRRKVGGGCICGNVQ